ncbi:MAG: M20/M25/M40 family metallo-hydrolase [Planctomycetaceae bacterium]
MMRILFLAGVCVLTLSGWSRAEAPADVDARLRICVETLANDDFEGRGIGTQGLKKAQQYVRDEFTAAGLNVVSAGGDPFQEFDVVDGAELTAPNTLEFLGPQGATIPLQLGTDFQVCSFGDAAEFSAPLVFAGYGIESTEPVYNDYMGVDVKGKVVVLLRRTPQQGHEQGLFDAGPHGTSRHAGLRTKVSNAFRRGAAAILFVNDPYSGKHEAQQIADQLEQARQDEEQARVALAASALAPDKQSELEQQLKLAEQRVKQTELVAKEHQTDPLMAFGYGGTRSGKAVPILHITQAACDKLLLASMGKSLREIEAAIDETGKPLSAELTGWTAAGETNLMVKRVDVANVIGVLEGQGPRADETIVIGAHYDHIGFGGDGSLSPNSHEVHNGADDNASGTAALIELARRFARDGHPPERRLVFIAFTGEERGLLGSAQYVKDPLFPLEKTIAMFNMDMVGRLVDNKLTVFGTGTSPRWEGLVDMCAAGKELELIKKPEGFGPSDHSSFYAKQIPVLHLFTGTHDDYHRPTDDAPKINVDGMRRIVDFLACIVQDTLANPERPKYIEIAERATLTRSGNRPYFGSIPDFSTDTEGYALQGVAPGSPAALGGLRGGDIIVQLGEDQIGSLDDFDLALRKFGPGQQVTVVVLRGGQKLKLQIVLAAPRG